MPQLDAERAEWSEQRTSLQDDLAAAQAQVRQQPQNRPASPPNVRYTQRGSMVRPYVWDGLRDSI